MKKIVIFFICLFCIAQANAVTKKKARSSSFDYYKNEYVSEYAFSFYVNMPYGSGEIYVECSKDKKIWLKYQSGYGYSSVLNESGISKECILKGKHIYLKLSNDEVITLECKRVTTIHTGYYTGSTDIWKEYKNYCYFDLSKDQIEKLSKYEIIKMRCEQKKGVVDIELKEPIKLYNDIERASKRTDEKLKEEKQQNELNANPLKDF